MSVIVSEQQAEQIGSAVTGGTRDKDFAVFQYEDKRSRLTLFGVRVFASGRLIHSR